MLRSVGLDQGLLDRATVATLARPHLGLAHRQGHERPDRSDQQLDPRESSVSASGYAAFASTECVSCSTRQTNRTFSPRSRPAEIRRAINVGVDATGFRPISDNQVAVPSERGAMARGTMASGTPMTITLPSSCGSHTSTDGTGRPHRRGR